MYKFKDEAMAINVPPITPHKISEYTKFTIKLKS